MPHILLGITIGGEGKCMWPSVQAFSIIQPPPPETFSPNSTPINFNIDNTMYCVCALYMKQAFFYIP